MIKRVTAISLILLANLILLAHVIIPHHHNNGLPSLIKAHSKHHYVWDSIDHDHNTEDHDHNTDSDSHYCILNQIVYTPTNSTKQECKCINFSNDHKEFQTIILSTSRGLPDSPLLSIFKPTPILKSFYSVYVKQCSGLRAPPLS